MVTYIFQDHFGFMWFATLDGLNRYDGYHFVVYRHDTKVTSSISEGLAQTLFEDSKGRLWIATLSGLDLFDRKTETFIHLTNQKGSALQNPVDAIAEDALGNIWVHSSDGLKKLAINDNRHATALSFSIRQAQVPFHSTTSLLSCTKNRTLYYTNVQTGLVYKLDDAGTESWSLQFALTNQPTIGGSADKSPITVIELVEDPLTEKIYAFHNRGITRVDEKTGRQEVVYRNACTANVSPLPHAALDTNGVVWFCGKDGLLFFDMHTGQLAVAAAKDTDVSRTLRHAYCTFVDRSGLLWIGSGGYGILKRNSLSDAFHHTSTLYTYSIKERADGKIILGNNLSRAATFDRAKEKSMNEKTRPQETADKSFSPFSTPLGTSNQWGHWFIDKQGLGVVDRASKKTTYYHLPVTQTSGFDASIQCSLLDSNENVWFSTTEGLLRFNLNKKQWISYRSNSNDPVSLSSNIIFSLCLDPAEPKKYLWVGTGGSGLNRMDMATGQCQFYSTKNGLPNNVVYSILTDDDKNLWMSTNNGLSCFNPQAQTFRNFDYKDGLQSNEFNRGASLRAKDGCLFFGGVNGFNYFYPRDVLKNTIAPPVEITALKIRNQPISVQSQNTPLNAAVYLTKKLTLPYTENIVSFEFASMDFTDPEKNQYQYKLDGFDKDWVHSGNVNSATYTNLDPGTYTFTVRGSNSNGTWNNAGTSLQLIILPPWYMTWWFKAAVAIIISLAAYAFYRYRLAHALKLQAIRNRIAGDLHDEVGSNLSNIYIFSNVAQQKAAAGQETAPLLQKINNYTQQSMEAMSDIVWMINTRNDRFENIMVRMRSLAAEFAETSACSLHLDLDERLNDVKLNMEDRKNFYLIYKEAINNVAKYAGCRNLWVQMKLEQHTIVLQIRDNGKGFDTLSTIKGNGIINMKNRAKLLKGTLTVGSRMGEGTLLTLRFKV